MCAYLFFFNTCVFIFVKAVVVCWLVLSAHFVSVNACTYELVFPTADFLHIFPISKCTYMLAFAIADFPLVFYHQVYLYLYACLCYRRLSTSFFYHQVYLHLYACLCYRRLSTSFFLPSSVLILVCLPLLSQTFH